MTIMKKCSWLACLGTLTFAHSARADRLPADDDPLPQDGRIPIAPQAPPINDPAPQPPAPEPVETYVPPVYEPMEGVPAAYSYAWTDPRFDSGIGIGLSLGGGVSGFTDRMMRDTVSSQVGGLWETRAVFGTRIPIGLEVGYLGTADNINTFAGSANGTLIGTTVEGALRWNVLPHAALTPYAFAGIGWQRYDVQDVKVATSDSGMKNQDNVAEFPMGTGLSLRDPSGFTVDLRGTFRAATDSTLLLDQSNGAYAKLHSWEASAALGYEF